MHKNLQKKDWQNTTWLSLEVIYHLPTKTCSLPIVLCLLVTPQSSHTNPKPKKHLWLLPILHSPILNEAPKLITLLFFSLQCSTVLIKWALELEEPRCESWFLHLQVMWSWVSYLTTLCLSFFVYKIQIIKLN